MLSKVKQRGKAKYDHAKRLNKTFFRIISLKIIILQNSLNNVLKGMPKNWSTKKVITHLCKYEIDTKWQMK